MGIHGCNVGNLLETQPSSIKQPEITGPLRKSLAIDRWILRDGNLFLSVLGLYLFLAFTEFIWISNILAPSKHSLSTAWKSETKQQCLYLSLSAAFYGTIHILQLRTSEEINSMLQVI